MVKNTVYHSFIGFIVFLLVSCQTEKEPVYLDLFKDLESISGKKEYLNSPYLTAGNRLYMVGHQNGNSPDLGWHVEGEMGGIWSHPIKLMDGFLAHLVKDQKTYCLNAADQFINYPIGNQLVFLKDLPGVEIRRVQFVPEDKEGIIISFEIENLLNTDNAFSFHFTGLVDLQPVWLGERTDMIDHPDELQFIPNTGFWHGKDAQNEWHTVFGSSVIPDHSYLGMSENCNYKSKGKGASASLEYELLLKPNSKKILNFYISGSSKSFDEAQSTFQDLKQNGVGHLQNKIAKYSSLASLSQVSLPDTEIQQAFNWVKYNTEWLLKTVPEIGTGYTAGMPDYPWWFGVDNEYTLKGAILTGQKENVYSTIDLLYQPIRKNQWKWKGCP
jgi:hypothetical protein